MCLRVISDVRGLEIKTPPTVAGTVGRGNIFWGTTGYLVTPSYDSGVAFDYEGNELASWKGGTDQLHVDNFVAGVRGRNPVDIDIEEGHISSVLAHLANASWTLGGVVPPATRPAPAASDEHMRSTDPQANALFGHEYRQGFELPRA